jgi:multidrug efflux pump subunit AcrA (membrane-fusion protein)
MRAPSPGSPSIARVRTAKARTGNLERTVRITGMTTALRSSYLVAPRLRGSRSGRDSSELSLTLEKLLPPGAMVRKGQVVAAFDRQMMILRADDDRASIAQQRQTMLRLEASLMLRRVQQQQRVFAAKGATEKAALDLKTAPVRSAMQVERFRMNYEEATARIEQLEAETQHVMASETASMRRQELELLQLENELQKVERNIDSMVFTSSMDGVLVVKRVYRNGEYVEIQEGDTVGPGQAFAEIVDSSSMILEGSANQVDSEQIRVGLKARVYFDAFPEVHLPGRVMSIAAAMKTAGQRPFHVREVPVRVTLNRLTDSVIPNLSASADIVVDSVEDVVLVPAHCVFRDAAQKPYALVQAGEGWIRRDLELGLANHVEVAVQSGVRDGETLAAEMPALIER